MADPLFDAHGITIPDPSDGYMSNTDVNTALNQRASIPASEMSQFFTAIRLHWDHHHFAEDGDQIFLRFKNGKDIGPEALPFDYSGVEGHTGLDLPPA